MYMYMYMYMKRKQMEILAWAAYKQVVNVFAIVVSQNEDARFSVIYAESGFTPTVLQFFKASEKRINFGIALLV